VTDSTGEKNDRHKDTQQALKPELAETITVKVMMIASPTNSAAKGLTA